MDIRIFSPDGLCLFGSRFGGIASRCGHFVGTVYFKESGYISPVAQCCGRPSNEKRAYPVRTTGGSARTLSEQQAAVLIPDNVAEKQLIPTVIELLKDIERLRALSENIATFAQYNSAKRIVDEVVKIIEIQ